MEDGLGQALNGANRLGDGVKIRAIQNIRMRNRWSVTGPQAMSAGSRDSQHEGRDGMPQQDQLGQSWAATIETVKTGVERAAKEGSDTPRTRERCKGLANTDEDEPGGTDAEADAHRGRDTVETRPADFSGDGAVNTLSTDSLAAEGPARKGAAAATNEEREAATTTETTTTTTRWILTIDNAARERRLSNVCTAGEGPHSRRPSTPEAEWISATGRSLECELSGSAGRLAEPRGGCAAVGGGAFVPSRWAVPSPYPDATIAFVTVRERLTSVPGHDLRADAIDGMRRMCKQMCNMCKQNWAMWRGSNSNGHFKAEIPTSVLIELVPVGS